MARNKKRRNFQTTKNTQPRKVNITSSEQLKQLTDEKIESDNGKKLGLIINIKHPVDDDFWSNAIVVKKDNFIKGFNSYIVSNEHKEQVKKMGNHFDGKVYDDETFFRTYIANIFCSKFVSPAMNGINYEDTNVDENVENLLDQAICYSYLCNKETIDKEYNSWLQLDFEIIQNSDDTYRFKTKFINLQSYENYSKTINELTYKYNDDVELQTYEEVESTTTSFKDEDVTDITVDDIELIEDGIKPMFGLRVEVLEKLKNNMSVLKVGQTIKIKKSEVLRRAVYRLNQMYFPDKKFSVYDAIENMVIFLK